MARHRENFRRPLNPKTKAEHDAWIRAAERGGPSYEDYLPASILWEVTGCRLLGQSPGPGASEPPDGNGRRSDRERPTGPLKRTALSLCRDQPAPTLGRGLHRRLSAEGREKPALAAFRAASSSSHISRTSLASSGSIGSSRAKRFFRAIFRSALF